MLTNIVLGARRPNGNAFWFNYFHSELIYRLTWIFYANLFTLAPYLQRVPLTTLLLSRIRTTRFFVYAGVFDT